MTDDQVLIKLVKGYSKKEIGDALTKRFKALLEENGTLKSEIQHLEHTIRKRDGAIKELNRAVARLNTPDKITGLKLAKKNTKLTKEVNRLKSLLERTQKSNNELILRINQSKK